MGSLIPTVYMSTDPGAPQLSGQVGSLTTLLDALLVDGYGTGETAKEGLGWSREFTDTNIRVYRNDPVLGTGKFLHVNDAAAGSGGAREALVRGYSNWSGGSGVNPFPTPAELAAGLVWGKSATADATARTWVAIGNAVTIYLLVSAYNANLLPWQAGDFKSFKAVDPSCFIVAGFEVQGSGNGDKTRALFATRDSGNWNSAIGAGCYLASSAAGDLTSKRAKYMTGGLTQATNNPYGFNTGRVYPGAVSGGLDLQRCLIGEGNYAERGWASGVYQPLHTTPLNHLEIYPGAGPGGADLLPVNYANSTFNNVGQLLFELGVEW